MMNILYAGLKAGLQLVPPAALALFSALAPAQEAPEGSLYRWEDADGIVNFSSSPPPEGVEATVIRVPPDMDDSAPTQEEMKRRLDALNNVAEPMPGQEEAEAAAEPPADAGAVPVESDQIMQERGETP